MLTKIFAAILSLFCVLFPHLFALDIANRAVLDPAPDEIPGTDRIHFMRTGSSDAILLESDGHFAMVDAGEDTDNPRGFDGLNLPGYEQDVLAYLKAHAADENGKVYLDFVLGTHAHSDHIGGFDTILLDPDVTVGRAYLKQYDSSKINEYEIEQWDNQEVYDQMVDALNERGVPVISEPDGTPFELGNFTVTLFNTDDPENPERVGENDQSLGVLLEKNGTRIFLAGDMDDNTGDETRLAPEIGKVDLFKVGHHSYSGSTTQSFVETLRPDACVITNSKKNADLNTVARIVHICRHKNVYITGNENGVLAVIGDNGDISYYGGTFDDINTSE
ncbi:MAG: MBL fold metallo-hydrolase [Clostridia bacterium]|nr:MBL fold metallo-hydrolase [Clostridia bacterium]